MCTHSFSYFLCRNKDLKRSDGKHIDMMTISSSQTIK